MTETVLLFEAPTGASTALVFGDDIPAQFITATLAITVGEAVLRSKLVSPVEATIRIVDSGSVSMYVATVTPATIHITTPPSALHGELFYESNTQRPTVAHVETSVQVGVNAEVGVECFGKIGKAGYVSIEHNEQDAVITSTTILSTASIALGTRDVVGSLFTEAQLLEATRSNNPFDDGVMIRVVGTGLFQEAIRRGGYDISGVFEDGLADRRPVIRSVYQDALRRAALRYQGAAGPAVDITRTWYPRYQDARQPLVGITRLPLPPVVPPIVDFGTHLIFACPPLATPYLIFGTTQCDPIEPEGPVGLVVVPVRRVYIVINNASLRRVDGNIHLPTFGMSLSLDVDSWTWGFSASLPAETLSDLEPASSGAPVEVEALVNGVAYRALVESITRNRTFGKSSISIQGRGKTALLDTPYAPVSNFTNIQERTAQQIMGDVLSVNGIPMPWTVNWGLTDWVVPTGVFSHQGSYIGALNAIAGAAGGYLQPHPSAQAIDVLARYPSTPWTWGGVTPDFELPSSVTTNEGIAWVEKARYNRVYVSGTQQGVLGQITRTGTAGDLVAPMVTDPLITHADAARQRGLMVLANTGRQATVSLKLPVLAETGIIAPGKFVRYVDGGTTRIGIVRSVGVDITMPEIFQTIGVETHVN